MTEKEG